MAINFSVQLLFPFILCSQVTSFDIVMAFLATVSSCIINKYETVLHMRVKVIKSAPDEGCFLCLHIANNCPRFRLYAIEKVAYSARNYGAK